MLKNKLEVIARVFKMIQEEYGTKFDVGTEIPEEETTSKAKVWAHILREFEDETILSAALHLVSMSNDWPPTVAAMREQCICLADGELHNETGSEAWEQVVSKMHHEEVELSDDQRKALKQTGRTMYDLRQLTIPALGADRARYIEAFDNLQKKKKLERVTLPEVKALAERNRPALPAPVTKLSKQLPGAEEAMSFEEAEKVFGEEMDTLRALLGIPKRDVQ